MTLWMPKKQRLFAPMLSSFGGGSVRGFNGGFGGGSLGPPDPIASIPSSEGQLVLSGYGFEAWKTGYGNGAQDTFSFTVPTNVAKIRCILIGGGGGTLSGYNIQAASGGGGIEFFCDVSPNETLTCLVGKGGEGVSSGTHGAGGDSVLKRGSTILATGEGGYKSVASGGTSSATGTGSSNVTTISVGTSGRQGSPNATESVSLSGAMGHAGGSATWSSSAGNGIGFGGGCGAYTASGSGGTYGYRGNQVNSSGDYEDFPALGPVRGKPNPEDNGSNPAGGCGGSFGGGAIEAFAASSGAGGLVRIWWANSSGEADWIDTGGNYV